MGPGRSKVVAVQHVHAPVASVALSLGASPEVETVHRFGRLVVVVEVALMRVHALLFAGLDCSHPDGNTKTVEHE